MKHLPLKTITPYLLMPILSLIFSQQVLAAFPSSDNYQIQEYTFGAGGTKESNSASYIAKLSDVTVIPADKLGLIS